MSERVYYQATNEPQPDKGGAFFEGISKQDLDKLLDHIKKIEENIFNDVHTYVEGEFQTILKRMDRLNASGSDEIKDIQNRITALRKELGNAFSEEKLRSAFKHKGVYNFGSVINIADNPEVEKTHSQEGDFYWDFINRRLRIFTGDSWQTILNK